MWHSAILVEQVCIWKDQQAGGWGEVDKAVTFQQVKPTDTTWTPRVSGHHFFNKGIIRLPELEDYWKTLWVEKFLFFPVWCSVTALNCSFFGAPCKPFHQPAQKDQLSQAFCWENPFKVSEKVHSHSRSSCWWNHVEVSSQICRKTVHAKQVH